MLCFVFAGYRNRKNASETERGFHKHEQHLSSYTMWKERERRASTGKEISTLLNADLLQKNKYYMSSIIDVIGFLVENQLPLQGKLDASDNMAEGGSGLFLSLLDYTTKKDPLLADAVKTLPWNATYPSHDIQNELISLLSDVVTEAIVEEVGNFYFTLATTEMGDVQTLTILAKLNKAGLNPSKIFGQVYDGDARKGWWSPEAVTGKT